MLAHSLPKELISEVLLLTCSIQDENFHHSCILGKMVEYLPEKLMNEALAVPCSIKDDSYRAAALQVLAPYLPEKLIKKALDIACSIQDEHHRAEALSGLIPRLKTIETNFIVWKEILHLLAYGDRELFLTDIPNLAPAIISLSGGDKKALQLVVGAMRDVCRQWP
mgnify:FL=1